MRTITGEAPITDSMQEVVSAHGVVLMGDLQSRVFAQVLEAIRWLGKTRIPVLGCCQGFHAMVRHAVCHDNNTFVVDSIAFLSPLPKKREGLKDVHIAPGSRAHTAYRGALVVSEMHNHFLYPRSMAVRACVEQRLLVSGYSQDGFVEIMERYQHPFWMGALFHPERRSSFRAPHPLILNFVAAAMAFSGGRVAGSFKSAIM